MSTQDFFICHPKARWIQIALLTFFAMLLAAPLMPTGAGAQTYGQAGGGGFGMMGGGDMMGGSPTQARQQLSFSQVTRFIEHSTASARVMKARKEVIFSGTRVFIAMAAVQPGFPDTTFEVAGLVDPTIEVPAGATVTLLLINMDYGANMSHGVVVTEVPPPYPVLSMMGMSATLTGVPVMPPRDIDNAKATHYPAESVTFTAPKSGADYFYLCQYRDHASKGMFGRFIVR